MAARSRGSAETLAEKTTTQHGHRAVPAGDTVSSTQPCLSFVQRCQDLRRATGLHESRLHNDAKCYVERLRMVAFIDYTCLGI